MSRSACIALLAILLAPPARATCTFPPPVRERSVLPADGETGVPTSVRVRVTYATGAQAMNACGPAPSAPTLRLAASDGGIMSMPDGGASPAGAWIQPTDVDPRTGTVWEFRPSSPLAPGAPYELLDPWT